LPLVCVVVDLDADVAFIVVVLFSAVNYKQFLAASQSTATARKSFALHLLESFFRKADWAIVKSRQLPRA